MTRLIPLIAAIFAFFMTFSAAQAQIQASMTALQLQNLCASSYDVDVGVCGGYITAVADRLQLESDPRRRVCLSPAISPQTLMSNVMKAWEADKPKPQDFAWDSVEMALRTRFQCVQ